MKASSKVFVGVTLATATLVGIAVYRRLRTRRMLKHVASEGYETAHDVHYPDKKIREKRLQYGPVIPDTGY